MAYSKLWSIAASVLGVVLYCATTSTVLAQGESRSDRDASGIAEAMQMNNEVVDWKEIGEAYDRASANWLTFFGESPFIRARANVDVAVDAMRRSGWLPRATDVGISMLDARGDFAFASSNRCTVHVNIDNRGSSPIISALGNYGSSVTFVAAHELAHCWFDQLSDVDKFPTLGMLKAIGVPEALRALLLGGLQHPTEGNGTLYLLDSYDEALADAAAAMALRMNERTGRRFGQSLENAKSLRLGELAMAKRRGVTATEHQGGFVFDAISRLPDGKLDWFNARQVAMQSVLASTFYTPSKPKWVSTMERTNAGDVKRIRRQWSAFAAVRLKGRNFESDENRFLSAISPAIFAIDDGQVFLPTRFVEDENDSRKRWHKVAWQSTEDQPFEQSGPFDTSLQRQHLQAIVKRGPHHQMAP